ncbi:MAG: PRC-barrel domain containing protein [Sphingomonas sp.]
MEDIAGWIALGATTIAAVMTASNLGSRVTGWGFVLFSIGAVAWIVVGFVTDQRQLLYSNIFLLVVDIVGIWRWLGRQARFDDAAALAASRSRDHDDALFAATHILDMPVQDADGRVTAHAVEAMTACRGGGIAYLIVRMGGVIGVGEELRHLPWARVRMGRSAIMTDLSPPDFAGLPRAAVTA